MISCSIHSVLKSNCCHLSDVWDSRATLEERIAQLSVREMAKLCAGNFRHGDRDGSIE